MKKQKDDLKIDFRKKEVYATLTVAQFQDHEHFVIYVPSLQITAYGDNLNEAFEMFKVEWEELCRALLSLPEYQAVSELEKYGWIREKLLKKKFHSEAYLNKEGILANFNLPEKTTIVEQKIVKEKFIEAA
jgi:hypothetical protein